MIRTEYINRGESRQLSITVAGGLGDQICAEPVLRYMRDTFYGKDDIVILTQYPLLFKHLPYQCFDEDQVFKTIRSCANTHPPDFTAINFHRTHPVDFIALLLLRRQLPRAAKTIQIHYSDVAKAKIQSFGIDFKKSVIVHPGISWASKTFPLEFWQSVIDLLSKDFQVVVVGNYAGKSKHRHHATGHLPVRADHCVDLREKLSLEDLFALIAHVPVLVTNDSGPVHAAGAFDNHIGLIPTCKHPDYILPYRKGGQDYKAQVLWKSDASVYYDFDPLCFLDVPIADVRFHWPDVLPTTEQVYEFVRRSIRGS